MLEFFRGWKRKVSVLTLALACLLAVGYVRSLRVYEFLAFFDKGKSGAYTSIISMRGYVTVAREFHRAGGPIPVYTQFPASENVTCSGLIILPYMLLVLLLAALSLWLLLSKPGAKKSLPAPESKE